MTRPLSALLTIFLASSSAAQDRPLPPLVERMEVSVVNVEVIVTDREGKRVTGLTREDFEIFENGKRKSITNFYEASAPSSAPTASEPDAEPRKPAREPLHLAIVVDEYSLNRSSRDRVLGQLRSFVESTLTEGDRAMVGVWNIRLTVPVPFTADRGPVLKAISAVGQGLGPMHEQARDVMERELDRQLQIDTQMAASRGVDLNQTTSPTLRSVSTTIEIRRKSAALRSVIRRMSGLEGRKILVFLTQRMPVCAIDDATVCDPFYSLQQDIDRISDAANAEDVILYTLYAAPNDPDPDTMDLMRAQLRDQNSLASLNSLARASGGLSGMGPDLGSALAELRADLNSYYSLGYSATRGEENKARKIRVTVKNPAYRVRTRAEVVDKSAEAQISDQLVSDLLNASESPSIALPFEVKLGTPRPQPRGRFLVRASISIPVGNLTFVQEGNEHRGGFFVHLASVDGRGDTSGVTRKHHRMTVPLPDLDLKRESTFVYELDVVIDKRGERLAFALVDEISGEAGTKVIDLPPL